MPSGPISIGIEDNRLMLRIGDTTLYHPLKDWNGTVLPARSIRGDTEVQPLVIDFDIHAERMGFVDAAHFQALVGFLRKLASENARETGADKPADWWYRAPLGYRDLIEKCDSTVRRKLWGEISPMDRARLRHILGVDYEQKHLVFPEGTYPNV